jgi:hypothetical protein
MGKHLFVAAAVVVLTLLSFAVFPSHSYLFADTQIYAPILERLWNPGLLNHDLVATEPHVSFTIHDEVALAARRFTGAGFREILTAEQFLFRALGIWGVMLIAMALGLSRLMSALVAGIFALSAWVWGPIVLTVEVEPIPRGFAIPLVLLGVGLAAHGRDLAAGLAVGLAFLYHPPAVYPYWVVYFCLTLWPSKPEVMRRRIVGLLPLAGSVLILLILSRLQAGESERQVLLGRIEPWLETLQRLRGPYNWISIWGPQWIWHYLVLWAVSVAAYWRLRRSVPFDLRFFLLGLPAVGMLSMPVSYLLLEKLKLALIPQFQPMRALLFVTVLASVLAAAAGIRAAQNKRLPESFLWFIAVFALPLEFKFPQLFFPFPADDLQRHRMVLLILLAALAMLAAWTEPRWRRASLAAWCAAVLLPFWLLPGYGKVELFTPPESPELTALADWARASTPIDAVFLFPDARYGVGPGVFRATALRAVYVDWKSGGQVNYLRQFSREWWTRWQTTMAPRFKPARTPNYAALGIDYVVVQPSHRLPAASLVFQNRSFLAYRVRP